MDKRTNKSRSHEKINQDIAMVETKPIREASMDCMARLRREAETCETRPDVQGQDGKLSDLNGCLLGTAVMDK